MRDLFKAPFVFGIVLWVAVFTMGRVMAGELQEAPNGTWVGGTPEEAPDGTWVGGEPQEAPDGTWVGVAREATDPFATIGGD